MSMAFRLREKQEPLLLRLDCGHYINTVLRSGVGMPYWCPYHQKVQTVSEVMRVIPREVPEGNRNG